MPKSMEKGFLYIAFGESFTKEALMSIKSLKRYNNEPVLLMTDQKINNEIESLIDIYSQIEPKHIRAKVDFICHSPFQKTVYLDSDTVVTRNISDMFDVLDRFDVGLVHDYARKRLKYSKLIPEYDDIPYSFSEFNGGIMAFNSTEETNSFFKLWREYFYKYYNQTNGWDQVSLRVSLWNSKVKIHTFPFEYNIRGKATREKVRNLKHEFGEDHLEPRIYHIHYDREVHFGKFKYKIDDLEEYEKIIIDQCMDY